MTLRQQILLRLPMLLTFPALGNLTEAAVFQSQNFQESLMWPSMFKNLLMEITTLIWPDLSLQNHSWESSTTEEIVEDGSKLLLEDIVIKVLTLELRVQVSAKADLWLVTPSLGPISTISWQIAAKIKTNGAEMTYITST